MSEAARWLREHRASLHAQGGAWVAISAEGRVVARGPSLQAARARVVKSGLSGRVVLARVAKRARVGSTV